MEDGTICVNGYDERHLFSDYFPEGADVFDSLFHYELDNFLVKNLHYMDRMSMANSVENRVPFLDYRLVEFAYNLSRNYKLSSFGKYKKNFKNFDRNLFSRYVNSKIPHVITTW